MLLVYNATREVVTVYQPVATSSETQHRRIERGAEAIETCLEVWLPGSTVETVQRRREESAATFRIRWGNEMIILWVVDEVLDLDAEGAMNHLRRLRVLRTLREEGAGKHILVTPQGTCIFPNLTADPVSPLRPD